MSIRKRLSKEEVEFLNLELREKDGTRSPRYRLSAEQGRLLELFRSGISPQELKSETKSNTYEKPFVLSAWNDQGYMMDIDQYCDHYKLPRKDIRSYKLVSHTGTPFYNIVFKENTVEKDIDYSFIEGLVKKHIKPTKVKNTFAFDTEYFDRVILTDAHIGMTPNQDGFSLYGGKWDKDELMKRAELFCDYVEQNKKGKTLIIDELGDLVDGWDGETVRKGHHLPQNMDNQEMFDTAVEFKLRIIDKLICHYNQITVNNICEDNHAGAFGYVVNSAFKQIVEQRYSNVKVVNHRKFINHYFMGKHCFVICHGKDSHALKFGFKPQLDPKGSEKIDQYIKQNDIYREAKFIEFSKGDSHQMLLDYSTSDDFDYFNYPAFSPSSNWIQSNFKKGRSGFVMQNVVYDKNIKEIKPYFFDNN